MRFIFGGSYYAGAYAYAYWVHATVYAVIEFQDVIKSQYV